MNKIAYYAFILSLLCLSACSGSDSSRPDITESDRSSSGITEIEVGKPNFLFIVSDDQSWVHTSKNRFPSLQTPNFDRVANEGLYFKNAFVAAPSCTSSRTAILSGRHIWQTESGALLNGDWPEGLSSYQDALIDAGYHAGYTGKGWGPGRVPPEIRLTNPTGPSYQTVQYDPAPVNTGIWDLAENFQQFLDQRPADSAFSFWVGSTEPHRTYTEGDISRFEGFDSAEYIPGFLANTPKFVEQLAAYLNEVELFDQDVGRILAILEKEGLLENTIIVVTSDNGMPFTRAKTQNYDYGVKVPLAIRWGNKILSPGREIEDMVSLIDIAPTFLQAAGLTIPEQMAGKSLQDIFASNLAGQVDPARTAVYSAYERHSSNIREGNLTYPRRAIHTKDYTYIRNYYPDRWPAGDPPRFLEAHIYLLSDKATGSHFEPMFSLATAKRPAEELYHMASDPFQINNLAGDAENSWIKSQLSLQLDQELLDTHDPVHIQGIDYFQQF